MCELLFIQQTYTEHWGYLESLCILLSNYTSPYVGENIHGQFNNQSENYLVNPIQMHFYLL